jgi:hypothetical protein
MLVVEGDSSEVISPIHSMGKVKVEQYAGQNVQATAGDLVGLAMVL